MMRSTLRPFAFATVVVASCARPAPSSVRPVASQPPPSVEAAPEHAGPGPVIGVTWRVADVAGGERGVTRTPVAPVFPIAGTVTLIAHIDYHGWIDAPLAVDVRVPSGARLVAGDAHMTLPPSTPGTARDVLFTVAFGTPPAGDLVLVADAHTSHMGFHAELPYRFGRPEPVAARLRMSDAPVLLHGVPVGHAVVVGAR